MTELIQMQCEACRIGAPHATPEERTQFSEQIPDWALVTRDGIDRLERTYRFDNFVQAMVFTNKVAELAESEGHHPSLLTEWGKVTVTWWSKKIKGLHRNDFVMAAKTDQLAT